MKAGALNRRLTFKNIARVDDGSGGYTRADTIERIVWAQVRPASAREVEAAMRREQRISHIIIIRWRADLAAELGPEAVATFTDNAGVVRSLAIKTKLDPDDRSRTLQFGALEGGPL